MVREDYMVVLTQRLAIPFRFCEHHAAHYEGPRKPLRWLTPLFILGAGLAAGTLGSAFFLLFRIWTLSADILISFAALALLGVIFSLRFLPLLRMAEPWFQPAETRKLRSQARIVSFGRRTDTNAIRILFEFDNPAYGKLFAEMNQATLRD